MLVTSTKLMKCSRKCITVVGISWIYSLTAVTDGRSICCSPMLRVVRKLIVRNGLVVALTEAQQCLP